MDYAEEDRSLELLNDTNYFKSFGFVKYGYNGLAESLGHNISTRQKVVKSVQGFSKEFVGWGMEDSYFGAKVIANGNFIIPVLSSAVYHIGYGPRGGDLEKKQKELTNNFKIYENLLNQEWFGDN